MKKFIRLLVFLIIIIGIIYLPIRLLKIQKVICDACDSDLSAKIQGAANKNIFDSINYLHNLLDKETKVLEYSIELTLPYNLKINIIEKKPVLAFKLQNGNYSLIDREGNVLGTVTNTSLPKILSSSELTNEQLAFVSSLMFSLNTFYNINVGNITADGLLINNFNSKKVIFPLSGDKEVLLGELNLIFSRLHQIKDASTINTIDLRFKNPVLK